MKDGWLDFSKGYRGDGNITAELRNNILPSVGES